MAAHRFITPNSHAPRGFDIHSILSPPESGRIESFSPTSVSAIRTPRSSFTSDNAVMPSKDINANRVMGPTLRAPLPISPPISPATNLVDNSKSQAVEGDTSRDPLLYPVDFPATGTVLPASEPLFPDGQPDPSMDAVVDQHMKSNSFAVAGTEPPSRAEYLLVASCCSRIHQLVDKSPGGYMASTLKDNDVYRKRKLEDTIVSAHRRLAPAPNKRPRLHAPPSAPRTPRGPKRTSSISTKPVFGNDRLSNPVPKAPRAPTSRDDVEFDSLPDYCPPLATLGSNSKALKGDWKGQALDLSQDKDRELLHEAEVAIAATLRLSCATYLCSKRRIFQGRLEALTKGKEFRKTDAQQACKIDVNKASKLWTAYDRVGWFHPEFFRQFL
ncbi:SWIRM domain-containing protein [Eremomyces bilateralis CBS 781.70]|uniref:SWIRM domain-containing protein n=1 Tax=Eremomyces bilateralis CBS 781.70 TaxID=1392243 RepID=A0A6G1G9C4_9PEZI|nr:SWIRM domain-containing protein [Eremomyces bilateralis CBS 781.70]KAF1814469.1 SWIRM domain-containing protein [Eremomyces bilateralis CBS 781.70]